MKSANAPDRSLARGWLPSYLALAVIWGASFFFIKIGVTELHPLYVSLGRVGSGALTLLVLVPLLRDRLPRDPRVWAHLAVAGTVGVAVPFTLFGYGEQRISSVLAGIWNATTPLVVLPVAVLVFRTEKMSNRKAVGLALGFVGVLVILGAWHGVGGSGLTGQLMCFGAALCYGVNIPYVRRFLSGRPESGTALAAGQMVVASVLLAAVAPVVAGAPPAPAALSAGVLASVLALGALGTGVAFALSYRVIAQAGATAASSVTYLLPVVATLIGVVALGEGLTWYQPVGALVVLTGVAVAQGVRIRMRAAVPVTAPPQPELSRSG